MVNFGFKKQKAQETPETPLPTSPLPKGGTPSKAAKLLGIMSSEDPGQQGPGSHGLEVTVPNQQPSPNTLTGYEADVSDKYAQSKPTFMHPRPPTPYYPPRSAVENIHPRRLEKKQTGGKAYKASGVNAFSGSTGNEGFVSAQASIVNTGSSPDEVDLSREPEAPKQDDSVTVESLQQSMDELAALTAAAAEENAAQVALHEQLLKVYGQLIPERSTSLSTQTSPVKDVFKPGQMLLANYLKPDESIDFAAIDRDMEKGRKMVEDMEKQRAARDARVAQLKAEHEAQKARFERIKAIMETPLPDFSQRLKDLGIGADSGSSGDASGEGEAEEVNFDPAGPAKIVEIKKKE